MRLMQMTILDLTTLAKWLCRSTLKTNPSWQNVTQELMPGQIATDRHDIVARVFCLKVQKLMNVVTKGKIFGGIRNTASPCMKDGKCTPKNILEN